MPQSPQQPIRVSVPSLGTVEFPAGTSPDTIEKALRDSTQWKPPAPEGSALSRAAGGFLSTSGLNPVPLIELGARMLFHPIDTTVDVAKNVVAPLSRLTNVGDAFRKAGLTGAANEVAASIPIIGPMAEHASQRMQSGDTAGGLGEVAGMIAAPTLVPKAVGATAKAVAPTVTKMSEGLMQSALKPGVAKMRDVIKGKTTVPPVVKTLLDEGITVSDSGVGKLSRLLTAKNDELKNIIANSNATISPDDVATRAMASRGNLETQVNNAADLKAFDAAIDEFVQQYGGTGVVKGGQPIPVQEAQALKTGTYANLGSKSYGELKGASVEGQKALARGLKEEIEAAIPSADVKGINQRIGKLQEAQDPLGRRVGMAANRDPGGLAPLAHSGETFLAMLMLRNPMVKSLLALGAYKMAAAAAKVPESAIRAAVTGVAASPELIKESK